MSITSIIHSMKMRLRTVLVILACASCLLMFSTIRCSLFSMSCTNKDELFKDLIPKYTKTDIAVQKFFERGKDIGNVTQVQNSSQPLLYQSYLEALKSRANSKGEIILVSTDYGYIQMALNLYFTSLKKFDITNYLYLTSDNDAAALLRKNGVAHFMMAQDKDGKKMSAYGTAAFARKTHIKTKIILEALKYGFTALITDVDIVFLKNPFPYLSCTKCDIQISSDGSEGNSGFYMARPTAAGITLHKVALETAARTPKLSNQKAVDRAMERMSKQGTLKMKMLSLQQFPHGNIYFEVGRRMFPGDNPCKNCVIVHNNWIVSGAAKIYRFKEHLLWMVDTDGYYSNPNAKYLVYDNPIDFGSATTGAETEALRAALTVSHMLGRILILPSFHCYGCKYDSCKLPKDPTRVSPHCSLNTHFRISTFDASFASKYREHVFLWNPLVPKEILQSESGSILIKTPTVMAKLNPEDLKSIKHQFTPANSTVGPTSAEVLQWLQPLSSFKVLRFHSMYKALGVTLPQHMDSQFHAALAKGLSKAGYRQY